MKNTTIFFTIILILLSVFLGAKANATDPIDESQLAKLESLRSEIANEIQLATYDLLDELVYGWTQAPVFGTPTPVVLVNITVPIGLGTGLQALLENHLANLLLKNPRTNIILNHCPSCTAVIVHSEAKGTLVSRGINNPKALAKFGSSSEQHALFIDVEAEGTWLVLRSRITKLSLDLPIVWARTLSSSASTPALLRQPDKIKSAAEAQHEYLEALHDRGPLNIPLRFSLRTFEQSDYGGVVPPPLIWFQTGLEFTPIQARKWTASVLLGYAWIPDAYEGFMAQTRISRLITGQSRSLTGPDLYFFFGVAMMTVSGPSTVAFQNSVMTVDQVLDLNDPLEDPRSTFNSWHIGLELRISNRIGASFFLEAIPSLENSDNLGNQIDPDTAFGIEFKSMGTEVTFCF